MDCREVAERLVAWQDAELSPGESTRVREHLARCPACRVADRRLADATPRVRLVVPPEVRARLEHRVDAGVILALADRPEARPTAIRVRRWLAHETRVPTVALAAYAVLLAATVAWGLSSAWSLARLDPAGRVAGDGAGAPREIPADQFVPAAYDPERSAIAPQDPPPGPSTR